MLRRAFLALIVLSGLLAAAGAIGWSQRARLAEWWLAARVAAMGLGAPQLRVASLDLRGIAIESVAIAKEGIVLRLGAGGADIPPRRAKE